MTIRTLVCVVGLATALSPATASAQSNWTGTVSVFGGGSTLPLFGANLADPALAAKLDVHDRKINNAPVFGGSFGAWHDAGGPGVRLGVRSDVELQAKGLRSKPWAGIGHTLPVDGGYLVP